MMTASWVLWSVFPLENKKISRPFTSNSALKSWGCWDWWPLFTQTEFYGTTPMVPNRGAAAHKGAVKRCQGCRQILNLLPFKLFFTTKGAPDCHFSQVRVPPIFFNLTGCRELKKVEKHWTTQCAKDCGPCKRLW
jgi:hypothetical protein